MMPTLDRVSMLPRQFCVAVVHSVRISGDSIYGTSEQVSDELRERAVRVVAEVRPQYPSQMAEENKAL